MDAETAPVIVAASPQSIPVAGVGMLPSLAMAGFGGGLFAFSAIPPILGKRGRTSLLPDPTDGIADTSRGLTRS